MKMAKRVLAVIVAVIMIVGTCAVAASAAYTTTVTDGKTLITLNSDTTETFTFNSGDVTIDLGGHTLRSPNGANAIIINGGKVTVRNGKVYSMFKDCTSIELAQTVFAESPSAIVVNGGELTVEGVRVVGSMARIPTTNRKILPTGTPISTKNGAKVTLKQATLIGDYGVDDKIIGAVPGGTVTVEDAIIVAYNSILASGVGEDSNLVVANGTEKINAADRIEGFLSTKLDANLMKLIKDMFDQRAYVFTKAPTADQKAKITITEGVSVATVEAPTISYVWPNSTSTDCSYELVPEAVIYSDKTEAPLNAVDAAKVDENAKIRYRVTFHICSDAARYLKKFAADPQYYVDLAYWGKFLDDEYVWNTTNNAGELDSYNEVVNMIGETLRMLDDMGQLKIMGQYVDTFDLYNELRIAILELGGAVAYNKTNRTFGESSYIYYYGPKNADPTAEETAALEAEYAAKEGMIGTLDKVQKLLDEVGAYRPFADTDNWGDIALWVCNNYRDAIEIVREAAEKFGALATILNPEKGTTERDIVDGMLDLAPDMKDAVDLVIKYADMVDEAAAFLDEALENNDVIATFDAIDDNKANIPGYVDQLVTIANDLDTYVKVSNFVSADGKVVKGYSTKGDVVIDRVKGAKKLDLAINGQGNVSYSLKQLDNSTTTGTTDIDGIGYNYSFPFVDNFTLTAVPQEEFEFLYWVNAETNRILSTETTLTVNTNIDRAIEAVFAYYEENSVTFTNPTGSISGYGFRNEMAIEADENVSAPSIPGFEFKGWPTTVINLTAYYGGSASAFADPNAFYGMDGATLSVRPGSNNLIVTPKYDRTADITITLYDPAIDMTYVATGPFGNTTDVVTAAGANFGYWADANGNVVSLSPEFSATLLRNGAKYTAVYGKTAPKDYVLTILEAIEETDGRVYFYAGRSVPGTLLSTGIVFHYTNAVPAVGMDGVIKGTAKYNTNDGIYYGGIKKENIRTKGNGTIYARPYAETAERGIFYGEVFEYKLG